MCGCAKIDLYGPTQEQLFSSSTHSEEGNITSVRAQSSPQPKVTFRSGAVITSGGGSVKNNKISASVRIGETLIPKILRIAPNTGTTFIHNQEGTFLYSR